VRCFARLALLLAAVAAAASADGTPQPNAPAKKPAEGWKREGFELSNPSADFRSALGLPQADFRSYQDWQVGDGSDDAALRVQWRRLQIGIDGGSAGCRSVRHGPAFDEGDDQERLAGAARRARAKAAGQA
jgi:hypothetical protein